MRKIYDSPHQGYTIPNWIKRGLILREGETYKDIYSLYMNTDFCNQCSVKFNNEINNQKRAMDHDHSSGYFRQVICMKCNKGFDLKLSEKNKSGHRWISLQIVKKKNSKVNVGFAYRRTSFKRKYSTSLTKLICLSFINILKKPV